MLAAASAALFIPAGRLDLPLYWLYLAILLIVSALALLLVDPALMAERMRPAGRPLDRRYWLIGLVPLAHMIIAGLDRGRWHLSDSVPAGLRLASLLLFAGGWVVVLWAMRANRFFSSVVRIQSDRGQSVIEAGPYQWVRHPGYAAALVIAVTSGPVLCSWLATLVLLPGAVWILRRTAAADRLLHAQLPGYADYATRVRYRILPPVW